MKVRRYSEMSLRDGFQEHFSHSMKERSGGKEDRKGQETHEDGKLDANVKKGKDP